MSILSLALRNLLRNRRRSLATLLAITLGAMAILLFGGYKTDIKYNLQTDYVRRGGHLQVQHKDFYLFGGGNQSALVGSDLGRCDAEDFRGGRAVDVLARGKCR